MTVAVIEQLKGANSEAKLTLGDGAKVIGIYAQLAELLDLPKKEESSDPVSHCNDVLDRLANKLDGIDPLANTDFISSAKSLTDQLVSIFGLNAENGVAQVQSPVWNKFSTTINPETGHIEVEFKEDVHVPKKEWEALYAEHGKSVYVYDTSEDSFTDAFNDVTIKAGTKLIIPDKVGNQSARKEILEEAGLSSPENVSPEFLSAISVAKWGTRLKFLAGNDLGEADQKIENNLLFCGASLCGASISFDGVAYAGAVCLSNNQGLAAALVVPESE